MINNPYIFLGASGLIVAYLIYTMIRRRKGLRSGHDSSEPEL